LLTFVYVLTHVYVIASCVFCVTNENDLYVRYDQCINELQYNADGQLSVIVVKFN